VKKQLHEQDEFNEHLSRSSLSNRIKIDSLYLNRRLMKKRILLLFTCCCSMGAIAQNGYIALTKKNRTVRTFWTGTHFTFQDRYGEWVTGILTKVTDDSLFMTRETIRYYPIGTDTLRVQGYGYPLADVQALPTKKEVIVYDNDHVRVELGHEKFVWVRNGFIFQVAGAGYDGLNIANDLLNNEPPFAKKNLRGLGIGAVAFLFGTWLHHRFDPYIHTGKKYRLQAVPLSGRPAKP
jgi:hypothetical protein